MSKFAVTARFEVMSGREKAFMVEMKKQAENSLNQEPGCLIFDICINREDGSDVLLYEIYTDKKAFDDHLASRHFSAFIETVTPWITSKKIECWDRI
ncbi:putative quinol monooxygenase [Sneathiella sp.]|uniref:putative quinol monooxygenase n=1 Tax=Sneathiella sp. TaxID=1964365 RepID=UPI0035621D11